MPKTELIARACGRLASCENSREVLDELMAAVTEVCQVEGCSVELYGERLSLCSCGQQELIRRLDGREPLTRHFDLRSDEHKLGELHTSELDPTQETLLRVLLYQASSRLEILGPTRNYREFFELSLDLLCVADTEGYFRLVNPRWTDILGYSLDELYRTPFLDLIHPKDRKITQLEVGRLLDGANSLINFVNRYRHKRGGYRSLQWQTRRVDQLYYAIARDVTVEHQQTERLRRTTEELQNFAYVASHDLKAPLRGIQNLADWIREDASEHLPEPSLRHLDQLQQRAGRMEALLDSLLVYSRAGRRVEPERIDLKELLEEVEILHRNIRPNLKISLPTSAPTLLASRLPLQQVLQNLLSNAVKHHPGPEISIQMEVEEDEESVTLTVSDDGDGIAPEHYERIFRIFSTLKPRDQVEGSGIGLALVKKVIESYGGEIDIRPNSPRGVRFIVTWPKEVSYAAH